MNKLRLCVCLALVLFGASGCVTDSSFGDDVEIVDGDSLRISGVRHRLHGIDAPEHEQQCQRADGSSWRCGRAASRALANLINGQGIRCEWTEKDQYQRLLSTCYLGSLNLNAEMVRSGNALAYTHYSNVYRADQALAKKAGVGLWQGTFTAPWDYRRLGGVSQIRAAATEARKSNSLRPVKGNISRKGERIYHCPEDKSYAKTKINTQRGERWFVNAAEAAAAGWRAAHGGSNC